MALAYAYHFDHLNANKTNWPIPYSQKIRTLALQINPYLIRRLTDANDREIALAIINDPRVIHQIGRSVWFLSPKWISLAFLVAEEKGIHIPSAFFGKNLAMVEKFRNFDSYWNKVLNRLSSTNQLKETQEPRDHTFERWLENYVEDDKIPKHGTNPERTWRRLAWLITNADLEKFTGKSKEEILQTYSRIISLKDRLEILQAMPRAIEFFADTTQAEEDFFLHWCASEMRQGLYGYSLYSLLKNPSERTISNIAKKDPVA
jgi:hypothetical protein